MPSSKTYRVIYPRAFTLRESCSSLSTSATVPSLESCTKP